MLSQKVGSNCGIPSTGCCPSQSLLQLKASNTRSKGKTARFRCVIDTEDDFDGLQVHWYRNAVSGGMQRILYISVKSEPVRDPGFGDKFFAENLSKEKASLLDIRDIDESDAGDYYCAHWKSTVIQRRGSPDQILSAEPRLQLATLCCCVVTVARVRLNRLSIIPVSIVQSNYQFRFQIFERENRMPPRRCRILTLETGQRPNNTRTRWIN